MVVRDNVDATACPAFVASARVHLGTGLLGRPEDALIVGTIR